MNVSLNEYQDLLKQYPDVLRPDDVSKILRICSRTVYKMLRQGDIESLKIGTGYVIPKPYLLDFLKLKCS